MSELVDSTIRGCILNAHIYSKVSFDNAKDTQELISAVEINADLLVKAVEMRISRHVEQLVVEKIEESINDGKTNIRVGHKYYTIEAA